ncbi:MAG: hypothetical protein NTV51_12115, partial [Verrucomicrobia bacterium]|nr:hypothetical protein [Verrucomicrobiota bacterium]
MPFSLSALMPYASALCCCALAVTAILVAGRLLDRWAFVAGMLALAVDGALAGMSMGGVPPDVVSRWQQWRLLADSAIPGAWLLFSLSYSRDRSGRKQTWLNILLCAGITFAAMGLVAFGWEFLFLSSHRANARGDWLLRIGWEASAVHGIMLVVAVAILMNLERTYRASVGTMRWRIKFMLLGVGVIFVARLYTSSQAVVLRGIDLSLESINAAATLLGCLLIARSFTRAGNLDIKVYPSQSVLQGSLTAVLAGLYLLIVGVLGKVIAMIGGGDTSFALKTFMILVALVLLTLILQSDRVRVIIRGIVSRHFSRPLYDYQEVWRKFTDGTAKRMEQTDLCRALARLVADVFQALSVTVWIVDEAGGLVTLGASTSLTEGHGRAPELKKADMLEVIRFLQSHPEPTEFESVPDNWAVILRQWQPVEFPRGGNRVCIPIASRGELLGLITVGDRVGGLAFSVQDFDMLKCVSEHAAANLLNAQLSQKLLQTKELESFQKMAAFFVHDLKNTASTLNLMLKNLPVHFDDPAFRADALRGIAKTVARMNDLTGRLNTLRHELKPNLVSADLNALVTRVAGTVHLGEKVTTTLELTPQPDFKFDRDQIEKVVVNLLLNAGEA